MESVFSPPKFHVFWTENSGSSGDKRSEVMEDLISPILGVSDMTSKRVGNRNIIFEEGLPSSSTRPREEDTPTKTMAG